MFLDEQSVLRPLLEIELIEVARFVTSKQALDQDGRTVAFETAFQSVNIDL